ncbi:MAG: sensor histidine kinase [Clostridiaceae bacterium]|nr:sensor histidine kinase [Clostridiaceae bacterium]MBW4859434.1 sensor histidine kinase [Clostridiaceae bacterium]MBW4867279.1 sensor histidine kinase [Clostridiaceae bacterium]
MSKIGLFRKLISKQDINVKDKILLSFIFGIYGIIGTYTGIPISGAIANARVVGIFVGGLLGGPFVGALSGIIAGGHRYLIDIGGFTAFACALSTLIEGVMAGFLKKKMEKYEDKLAFSLIAGMVAEILQMIIILIFAKPFSKALSLVKIIGIPMIITNGIGIAVFIAITDSIFKDLETAAAYQAQLALRIANKTLKYFRKGFNETTAYETATIIKEMTNVKAVSFSNREEILAHVGVGEDHHFSGSPIKTNLTRETIKKGRYSVANFQDEIGCENENCSLKSAIIVPLTEGNKVIGTLKLYKTEENSITKIEKELALGLAQIFSTQIELSKVDFQREMLVKSELKALQAQINPHFLFNAINTIVSLIRTQPDNARKLLIHLGTYFRNNLQEGNGEVELHKEIENINSYLEIEKARFGDKLRIVYNIPEKIDCILPPLLLQPIVENAVKHGVLEKIEGGTVEITAIDNEIETKLIVKDDGVGMSSETLSSLFNEDNNSDSIGLNNVNSRLKNKYGKEYRLKIDSKVNKGTIVTMTIPKKQRRKVV